MAIFNSTQMRGAHTITARNVSDALWLAKQKLEECGVEVETRNGKAIELREPISIVYNQPTERVLFYPERDANPIFHFMESLWMLAGRNDVEWISRFNKRMAEYSDSGTHLQGAYGYRWRKYFHTDQLETVVHRLRTYENDRRTVLTMWDVEWDLRFDNGCKDHPCNTHIYFSVRDKELDMTVCNRSNDMIWGAMGANAVHMSILQEYIASKVGVKVGIYTQFSNNLHAYLDTLQTLQGMQPDYDSYGSRAISPTRIVIDHTSFLEELDWFMKDPIKKHDYYNAVFPELAQPMCKVWEAWKQKEIFLALELSKEIVHDDWHMAVHEWLERRINNG
jgi:hypothetical protein